MVSFIAYVDGKQVMKQDNYACFAPLNGVSQRTPSTSKLSVEYEMIRCHMKPDRILDWHNRCNSWNFAAEYRIKDNTFYFKVVRKTSYISLLAPLVIRRYMVEFPSVVNKTYEFIEKYPNLNDFTLFQLAHYSCAINNTNHAFLGTSPYMDAGAIRKLVDAETIKDRLENFKPSNGIGLNDFIKRDKDPMTSMNSSSTKFAQYFFSEETVGDLIQTLS